MTAEATAEVGGGGGGGGGGAGAWPQNARTDDVRSGASIVLQRLEAHVVGQEV